MSTDPLKAWFEQAIADSEQLTATLRKGLELHEQKPPEPPPPLDLEDGRRGRKSRFGGPSVVDLIRATTRRAPDTYFTLGQLRTRITALGWSQDNYKDPKGSINKAVKRMKANGELDTQTGRQLRVRYRPADAEGEPEHIETGGPVAGTPAAAVLQVLRASPGEWLSLALIADQAYAICPLLGKGIVRGEKSTLRIIKAMRGTGSYGVQYDTEKDAWRVVESN